MLFRSPYFWLIAALRDVGSRLPKDEEEKQELLVQIDRAIEDLSGEDPEEQEEEYFELRRRLEYIEYLLAGRDEDIQRARDEVRLLIEEIKGAGEEVPEDGSAAQAQ